MPTDRDRLLFRFNELKKKARRAAADKGHEMDRVTRISTTGYTKCLLCGAELYIKLVTSKIEGSASRNDCEAAK